MTLDSFRLRAVGNGEQKWILREFPRANESRTAFHLEEFSPRFHFRNMKKIRGWSSKFEFCVACGTNRRDRSFKGYCTSCYPLVAKIEKINRGGYRRRGRYGDRIGPEYIKRQALLELQDIAALERPLLSTTTGHHIEGLLVTLAEAAYASTAHIYGAHYTYDSFDEKTRRRIYRSLLEVVETLPSRSARRIYAHRPFGGRGVHFEFESSEQQALLTGSGLVAR